jgi:hypothetical protein
MDIKRSGSQPSGKGPADWFTGAVRIEPLFEAPEPASVRGASVTFEPGAEPPGIRILLVRPWSSHRVSDGCSARAGQLSKSDQAMSFGFRPVRNTGTEHRLRPR